MGCSEFMTTICSIAITGFIVWFCNSILDDAQKKCDEINAANKLKNSNDKLGSPNSVTTKGAEIDAKSNNIGENDSRSEDC